MNLQHEVREDRDKMRSGKLSNKKFLEKWERKPEGKREPEGKKIIGKMKKGDVQKIRKGRKPVKKTLLKKLVKKIKREK